MPMQRKMTALTTVPLLPRPPTPEIPLLVPMHVPLLAMLVQAWMLLRLRLPFTAQSDENATCHTHANVQSTSCDCKPGKNAPRRMPLWNPAKFLDTQEACTVPGCLESTATGS